MKTNPHQDVKHVIFQLHADPAAVVFVAGTFNDWNPAAIRLRSTGTDAVYASIPVPVGEHEYKFVVNGRWTPDPDNTNWRPNEFGSLNSVLRV